MSANFKDWALIVLCAIVVASSFVPRTRISITDCATGQALKVQP